jgi:C4-dicarboxylate-specific signal transduction histidine kinase
LADHDFIQKYVQINKTDSASKELSFVDKISADIKNYIYKTVESNIYIIIIIIIIILLLIYRYLNHQAQKQALIDQEIQDRLENQLEEEIQRKIKKKYRKKKFAIDSEITYIPENNQEQVQIEEFNNQDQVEEINNNQENTNHPELVNFSSYVPHNLREMGSYHSLQF